MSRFNPGDIIVSKEDLSSTVTGNLWTKKGKSYTILPKLYRGYPCIKTEAGGFISLEYHCDNFVLAQEYKLGNLDDRYARAMGVIG